LDANWLVKHGIPTVTYGAGQNNIHTVDEFIDTDAFWRGCQFTIELAKGL
jgi:tripeptide aminopeptidase